MKIAVPTDDGISMAEHFGRSVAYLVFKIEDGKIQSKEQRVNGAHKQDASGDCHTGDGGSHNHANIVETLQDCDVVLCAGMGWRAAEALKAAGVSPVAVGVLGPAEAVVTSYVAGKLTPAIANFCHCQH